MDGVGTPIIGRPRPLPGHDTPNPAYHPHTLNYEEPLFRQNFSNLLSKLLIGIITPLVFPARQNAASFFYNLDRVSFCYVAISLQKYLN